MMRVCRELCGGQICVTPDFAAFQDPETAPWLEKYYTINEDWFGGPAAPARLRATRSTPITPVTG
jgi:4-hydroxyphenylacetate 3-hydroxylase C terminal